MRSYPAKRQIWYTIWFNWENFNLCSIIIIFKIFSFSVQNIIHIYLYIQILNLLSTLNYRSKCGYSSGNNLLCTCSSLHLSICHKHSTTSTLRTQFFIYWVHSYTLLYTFTSNTSLNHIETRLYRTSIWTTSDVDQIS